MNNFSACLMLSLLALSPTVQAECDFDDFPLMDDMKTQLIMGETEYNHRPMAVKSFSVDASITQVIEFYHRRWRDAYSDSRFGPWTQVSTVTDDCLMTVQAGDIPGVGTAGRLVVSNVPTADPGAELGEGVVAPGDATVVSDMFTDDGPKQGRVTVITSGQSVDETVSFYLSEMSRKGWWLENRFTEQGNAALMFRKGLNETNVVIAPAGEATQILVNEVTVQ